MNNDEKRKMKIIYSEDFSIDEMSKISNAFSKIVPIEERRYVRLSAEVLPTILTFSLGFVFRPIAAGFFNALGSDLYKKAKEVVIKIIGNKRAPILVFEMEYKGTKIKLESRTRNEEEISKIFDTIEKARDLAIKSIDSKQTPKMTSLLISYDDGWKLHSGQNWNPPQNVAFYSYNAEKKVWELTGTWGIENGKPYRIKTCE